MLSTSHPDPDSPTGDALDETSDPAATADGTTADFGAVPVNLAAAVVRRRPTGGAAVAGVGARSAHTAGRSRVAGSDVPPVVAITIGAAIAPLVMVAASLAVGAGSIVVVTTALIGAAISASIVIFAVVRPLTDQTVTAVLERSDAQQALTDERDSQQFRDRLDRALRSSQSEPTTIGICLRAVHEILPESEVSLLLNLPGEATIGWRVDLVDGRLKPAVPVPATPSCIGLGTLSTAVSHSSTTLDACDHLSSLDHDVSSVCIPLLLGERTLGAVSATSAPGEVPPLELIERAEWVIERAAVRVAEQRLQRGPSVAGHPDPVTGLPGPSALRHQLRDLVRTLSPFCVSIVSIDAFDKIRYDSGEEAADLALGLAADALCSTLRPDDLVCRIDGPRFAVVFADCTARQAIAAMERFRESLALQLSMEEGLVPFTCSAGLVESHRASSLDSLVDMSAKACDQAVAAGGNRVTQFFEN